MFFSVQQSCVHNDAARLKKLSMDFGGAWQLQGNDFYPNPNDPIDPRLLQFYPASSSQRADGELRIHNVLALAYMECERTVSLDELTPLFVNSYFNTKGFPALRIEVKGPLTGTCYTISLFDGGRIQSAGGCMPREAGICMKKVIRRIVQRLHIKIKFSRFEVHNLLGVVDLGMEINLTKLHGLAPGSKDYEPEKFPALRVSMPVPQGSLDELAKPQAQINKNDTIKTKKAAAKITQDRRKKKVETITASIFSNGKINFVGGKSVQSIVAVIDELRPFIEASSR
eukprot:Gregarina_sp_Poly_1__4696@NODE_2509_length_2045_cov_200_134479_g1594_i0_p2_GENE_NODE_2509_length_2045_cov_200_134479_g1594_i0NODE_2509_length_2045_cov_200_134479_g1594_i0_p2_ORF_typecomplete_len284_score37_76TBP/PF00352_21/2_6e05TBP/PF00352_21/7_1e16HAP/PF03866_13/1_1e03HAP/PF03866_13/0_26_NODE_2509_length_2045_cov_200_134479_g1594_i010871938